MFVLLSAAFEAIGLMYVLETYSFNTQIIALIIILAIVGFVYIGLILPKLINKYNKVNISLYGLIICALSIMIMGLSLSANIFIIMLGLLILSLATTIITLTTLIGEFEGSSGLILGTRNSSISIGSMIGPLVSSALYQYDKELSFVILGLLTLTFSIDVKSIYWRKYE